jgi:hypothetical protein
MANQDQPNQNANKSKAEGERWSSDDNSVQNADRDESPERQYDDADTDNAGGITNRPLSEEIDNQQDLPPRGTARESTGDPNATAPEGDYGERDL